MAPSLYCKRACANFSGPEPACLPHQLGNTCSRWITLVRSTDTRYSLVCYSTLCGFKESRKFCIENIDCVWNAIWINHEPPMKKLFVIAVFVANYCFSSGRSMDGQNANEWMSRCCGRTRRPYGKRLPSVACFLLLFLMLVLASRKLNDLFPRLPFMLPFFEKYFPTFLCERDFIWSLSSSSSSIAISPTVSRLKFTTDRTISIIFCRLQPQTLCAPDF